MTTLYRPVLIESAEQAKALGWKTPVQIVLARTREVHDVKLFEDFAEDFWPDALEPGNRWVYVALVPIEARRIEPYDRVDATWGGSPDSPGAFRYVTPWEAS